MLKKYFAENKETKEVYECNTAKIIADVRSEFECSEEGAIKLLNNAAIDNPLVLPDCEVWSE